MNFRGEIDAWGSEVRTSSIYSDACGIHLSNRQEIVSLKNFDRRKEVGRHRIVRLGKGTQFIHRTGKHNSIRTSGTEARHSHPILAILLNREAGGILHLGYIDLGCRDIAESQERHREAV